MFGEIMQGIGIASNLLGGKKGSGGSQQTQSGYVTQPDYIKELMSGDVFDRIKKYFNTGYQGVPMRELTAEELDPNSPFANKAMQYMQMIQKQQPTEAAPAAPVEEDINAKKVQDFLAAQTGQKFVNDMAGKKGFSWMSGGGWKPEDYAKLTNTMATSGYSGDARNYGQPSGGTITPEMAELIRQISQR